METLWQDCKYGLRTLLKSPAFTFVAVVSLALGIGANTAIFTLIKAVFLQPVPVREPQRLVSLFTVDEKMPGLFPISFPSFEDYRDRQSVFSAMAIYMSSGVTAAAGSGEPETWEAEVASGNYFELLGVKPLLGRTFTQEDDRVPGGGAVAVLSYGTWTEKLGGDAAVIGSTISINRLPFTIIGVMPNGFKGIRQVSEAAMWTPMSMAQSLLKTPQALRERRALHFQVVARLLAGVTLGQAEAALDPISRQLARDYPAVHQGRSVKLLPVAQATIHPSMRPVLERAGLLLMVIVGLVLLVACGNVAALLLVRARGRSKEFAIRLAVGAGSGRVARQLLTESVTLSLIGGLAGLLVARWSRDLLWAYRPPMLAAAKLDIGLDGTVLLFTFSVSALTGLLFGLAPALSARRQDLAVELKERSTQGTRERRFFSFRNLLVVGQSALCIVALVGAGLFIESLRRLQQVDPGFEAQHLAATRFDIGSAGYKKEQGLAFYRQLLERITRIPSVRAASLSSIHPFATGGYLRAVRVDGQNAAARPVMVLQNNIAERYFETAGVRLLEGREFLPADDANGRRVVIVNQSMARRLWAGENATGKRVWLSGDTEPREVVGVAPDMRFFTLSEEQMACVYAPLPQDYLPLVTLLVRTHQDPRPALGMIRGEIQQLERLPLGPVRTVEEQIGRSLWAQKLIAALMAIFGLLAVLLAAVGVYGLTSYSVAQRTSEIGLRMALGARPGDVLSTIVGQGMSLVAPGVALGLVAAAALGRLISSLLFGVSSGHVPAYLAAAALLALVALAACWLPARRATKVDPVLALRHE
ncbi:MAG: ABC transporter permease [Acidobacteria bacterium]|nr:ABC transporter permease [Acidobacteriota bacterium]